MALSPEELEIDCSHAVEVAHRVWWVGHELSGDPFQCHVYLIEHGDQSVLIDPGSVLTFNDTLRKIEEITPFSNIRYFICHHQDPDITGALGTIDKLISRDDACIVTHWRAEVLLKHYGLSVPMWLVDANDWKLDIGGRVLRFIFTPYLHFPGSFCTFDEETGVLFSSDLFGGYGAEEFSLIAGDESCFTAIKTFHEHYMPSREILRHSLLTIESEPIKMIAPQHGSIIPAPLVRPILEKLKELDCGLYLLAKSDTDIHRLTKLNQMMKGFMKAMVLYRDFGDIALHLLTLIKEALPVEGLEFYLQKRGEGLITHLCAENLYHGEDIHSTAFFPSLLERDEGDNEAVQTLNYEWVSVKRGSKEMKALFIPLDMKRQGGVRAAALLVFSRSVEISAEFNEILGQMLTPLSVAIERENIYRELESERNLIYNQSIRDSLTGLYNRQYMEDAITRLIDTHNRSYTAGLAVIIADIDNFKYVNDRYGHAAGDDILRQLGEVFWDKLRKVDIPVRYGGDEFCFFIPAHTLNDSIIVAERLREAVKEFDFKKGDDISFNITLSAGVALHRQRETLQDFVKKADVALYEAKKNGRDCVRNVG
ncbi:MAG: diguanylate cyclase [Thermodesulfobacteriota bacterium]